MCGVKESLRAPKPSTGHVHGLIASTWLELTNTTSKLFGSILFPWMKPLNSGVSPEELYFCEGCQCDSVSSFPTRREARDFSYPFVVLSVSLGIYLKQDRCESFQRQTGGSSAGVLKSRALAPGHQGKLEQWEEQALRKRDFSFSQLWCGAFHLLKPLQFLLPFPSKGAEQQRCRRWRVLGCPQQSPLFPSSLFPPPSPSLTLFPFFLFFLSFPLLSSLPLVLSFWL